MPFRCVVLFRWAVLCRSAGAGRARSAQARRRMSGAFSSVWKHIRGWSQPQGSLSFTSRKTSSSSNHDFHVHHADLEVRLSSWLRLAGAFTLQTLSLMVILDHQRSSDCWHHSAPNDAVVLCQPHNSRISHLLKKIQALSGLWLEVAWLVSCTLIGLPAGYKHCCINPHDHRRLVLLSC